MFCRDGKMSRLRVLAAAAGLLAGAHASAQNPEILATYNGAAPKQDFAFRMKDRNQAAAKNHTRPAGTLNFTIPLTEFNTAGLDRNFESYCAEPLLGVTAPRTYRFELQKPETPEAFGLPDTQDGRKEAERRAGYIRELFGKQYLNSLNPDEPDNATAFQAALWEIIQEVEFPEVPAPFDLFGGTFQADYPNLQAAPRPVQLAQGYLRELTGSDGAYYDNEALRTQELVRLKGLANAAGEVAQSQFGLRSGGAAGGVGGGTPGGTFALGAPGLGGPGGVGGGLGGGGFAGLGGGSGNGGGGGGNGGTNGGTTSTTGSTIGTSNTPPVVTNNGPGTTTSTVNGTTTSTGPGSDGPGTPGSDGPGTGPGTPGTDVGTPGDNLNLTNNPPNNGPGATNNTPVPAPPALILGLIAVGALAGRRAFTRAKKD